MLSSIKQAVDSLQSELYSVSLILREKEEEWKVWCSHQMSNDSRRDDSIHNALTAGKNNQFHMRNSDILFVSSRRGRPGVFPVSVLQEGPLPP